ncbi:patatin-like phospholipase family protein [Marinimicrobium sp. ABcell2]|uniref:patatin-like phospholipase family protein n=1 Tax=Marinimicrobium sp. ABcell2 TaxID=3069751 RepID=UPI0027B2DA56|nr:patatin-like phospholipase family protein [Marinimicrobium sp. ABcell2]MDQ2075925.1 patatin-like phospholipase family protein [Marinimicrobium sp. ABcell2]
MAHEKHLDSPAQPIKSNKDGKRIALVLGSGGARGLAHIGVIQELEARGYRIDVIAGCSMGALVGGFYAAGKLDAYTEWAMTLQKLDILKLLDLGGTSGLIAGQKIMTKLEEWIGDIRIEDLPIEYTAVAVDIEREREVWFSKGSLYHAIRASIAIPGVFTPHLYKGRILVDGSVLNPIPVAPTLRRMTDQIFVVDANGPPVSVMPQPEDTDDKPAQGWLSSMARKVGLGSDPDPQTRAKLSAVSVMERSLDTMMAALTRQHLAVFQPDMVFRVPRDLFMIHEFHRATEIIEMGRQLARDLLDNPELERQQKL